MTGIVVDLFAGGGGASTGIEAAIGRPVDLAINHDKVALAAHKANHPHTRHLESSVWEVKPLEATGGRPVDLLWASPDCTHFSVAKGSKPRSQKIRSLAWVVVRWAKAVQPAVICVENVQEFRGWGPLDKADGKPIKARMGETFRAWRRKLERHGYVVDYRILDASEYGAPTRRRRLFIVARRDGVAVVWPGPTHGKGRLPLHTAAECIDWALPCPSIFERKKELKPKTLWRIAQGIQRFVIDNPSPFIVKVNHGNDAKTGQREHSIDQPLTTITGGGNGHALVVPHVTKFQENSVGQDLREPLDTVMAGAQRFGVVAPHLIKVNHGKADHRGESLESPLTTITATQRGHALVSPTLIQTGYGEREGQAARVPGLDKPLGTVVAGGQKHGLVAAFLAKHFGDRPGGWAGGQPIDKPAGTITSKDHHSLAAATLVKLRGQCHGAQLELPMPTVTAGGFHLAEVRAFLTTYYSSGSVGQKVTKPLRTVTPKDRLAVVLVEGLEYEIVDIGMRMLQPEELLRAQFGRFAAGYDLSAARTKAAKVRLIGNSVPPEVAEAIVRSNVTTRELVAA